VPRPSKIVAEEPPRPGPEPTVDSAAVDPALETVSHE
jgi:hypothetical protein